VVSLHARGIRNVVAPLGTAFTPEQAKQVRRFAPRITLLFDGDSAGRKAVLTARDACRSAGLEAQVGCLPEGCDPDDLVRRQGAEGIERVVNAGRGLLEYLIDIALDNSFSEDDARSKAARIKEITELLAAEDDPAVRAMARRHADRIAARLGIADATTFEALDRSVRKALSPNMGANTPSTRMDSPARARSRDRRIDIGREILGALLDYPALFDTPEVLEGLELLDGELAAGIAALRHGCNAISIGNPEEVLAKLAPSIHPFALARLAAPRHERLEDARTELVENVRKLKGLELQRHKSEVVVELQRAAATGDFEQEVVLLREQMRRARERHGL
jgi:DNA primase